MPRSNHPDGGFDPANYQLAQLNVGRLKYPKDSPEVADFIDALDRVNALAEASDGFVWRLKDDTGNAMSFSIFDEQTLPNLSVWRGRESLFDFVYKSAHTDYLAKRKNWFLMPAEAHFALWWVPTGHQPDLEEAAERLSYLREHEPTPMAFNFKHFFDQAGDPVGGTKKVSPA